LAILRSKIFRCGGWCEKVPAEHDAWKTLTILKANAQKDNWTPRARKLSRYKAEAFMKMSSHAVWSEDAAAPAFKRPRPTPPPATRPEPMA
jgi:hypothetical protein